MGIVPQHSKTEVMGTTMHRLLQRYYAQFVGRVPEPLDASGLQDIWEQEEVGRQSYEMQLQLYNLFLTLSRYVEHWSQHETFTVLAVEQELFAPSGLAVGGRPIFLQAIIDLLVEDDHGKIGCEDHKSTQNKTTFYTNESLLFNRQLMYYWLILSAQRSKVDWVRINNINTYPYKKKPPLSDLFSRTEKLSYPPKMMVVFEQNLRRTLRKMFSSDLPVMNISYGSCKYCRFNQVCQTALAGLPVDGMLEVMDTRDTTFNFVLED